MRKLASIQKITGIQEIPNADSIETATIGGWKVVVRKGEYAVDDLVIYCEIDSFIPHEIASFLTKPGQEPKDYEGIKGQRLKTIKLRGQISQGLVLPTYKVPELDRIVCIIDKDGVSLPVVEGQDVTELLGIVKWEPEVDASLQGAPRGNFPYFLHKTDQERIQNLKRQIIPAFENKELFEVTEKLDGSSMSVYLYQDVFGVCSRNIDLTEKDDNAYWKVARSLNLESILRELGDGWAFQGELIGSKIQGNPYKLDDHRFYIFDIFNINEQRYLSSTERYEVVNRFQLDHVPIIYKEAVIYSDIDQMLLQAEGKSSLHASAEREGLVYKSISNPDFSFKVISNKFLMKN